MPSFRLGEPFEDEVLDGRWCQVVVNLEGEDKLVTEQKSLELDPPVNTLVTRQFFPDTMVMTLQCQEVVAIAQFKRLPFIKDTSKTGLENTKHE
jgi:hypothetical protein